MVTHDDVAIIGLSGLFPEAPTVADLHANLDAGRDSVRPLSLERMYFTSVDPSHDYTPLGWIDRVDLFDHSFFGISPREAAFMDPHQRIVLQLVCAAIEDAGYGLGALRGTDTGVFLSSPRPEYHELFTEVDPLELLGNAPSAIAGRVSYFLDLRG
ncbi:MAG TPA: beta-ketoacyl synthase N-terminal-like domain-containing protein, partial [Actinomycetota bacterium]|nr:beta-ketoacyl synthase N-terminal-like domain-containing protein [Actinomycetota bacterium]